MLEYITNAFSSLLYGAKKEETKETSVTKSQNTLMLHTYDKKDSIINYYPVSSMKNSNHHTN